MLVTRWVIVSVSLNGGLILTGPFVDHEEADEYVKTAGISDHVITPMEGPL